ncbi:hydroxymethylbilane synthase [Verrucomicrobiota bacterium]
MKQTITTGTRDSRLAVLQSSNALKELNKLFPLFNFELKSFSSPGDRDKQSDLITSAPDFFTRDLDDALLSGEIDCAVHSAKDLPDVIRPEIDWFWLPNPEDPRDVIIRREGSDLTRPGAVFGNSSERRGAYIQKFYPNAQIKPIRGNIEERIAKLDAGEYDAILMASAALNRLNLQHRISEWIPAKDLPAPEGQGYLALTFRKGDARFNTIRSLFVKSVTFVSAGIGDAGLCTAAGIDALKHCDVCLYDALMPQGLLENLPATARAIYVGKRSGRHSHEQKEISALIADYARQGKKVARLKGGDSGIFGRLAEEIDRLDSLELPHQVLPGVSSLSVASTGTGLLMTRRGTSRGFKVITTARAKGSAEPAIPSDDSLPTAIFMGIRSLADTLQNFPAELPVSVVFDAGTVSEKIISGTVADIVSQIDDSHVGKPGIVLLGETADRKYLYKHCGVLHGKKVWLTCSRALQPEACRITADFGGKPIGLPLIKLSTSSEPLPDLSSYDWIVLSSPSAVHCLMQRIDDVRGLPKILACGPGSARALKRYKTKCDLMPASDFSTEGILEAAQQNLPKNARILRLRSDAAGTTMTTELGKRFETADDFVICHNEPVRYETAPDCDAIFIASPSACSTLLDQFGFEFMQSKELVAIGHKTEARLKENGLTPEYVAVNSTVRNALSEWAHHTVLKKLEERS